jgi:hypothetical protein
LDAYVTTQVLAALAPAAVEVSLRAAEQVTAERDALDTAWRHRVERAEQAADRARRQYQLVEPENRLVARSLERQWETALADLDRLRGDYQHFRDTHPRTLSEAGRTAIRTLAGDLPAVWHAPTTSIAERNLPFGSGGSGRIASKTHLPHVSTLSGPSTRPGIRPVIRDGQRKGLTILSRFPAAFRRAGVRFLGILFPPGTWAFVASGLPQTPGDVSGP